MDSMINCDLWSQFQMEEKIEIFLVFAHLHPQPLRWPQIGGRLNKDKIKLREDGGGHRPVIGLLLFLTLDCAQHLSV